MKKEEKEQLFDLLLPPGVPQKIIADVLRQYDDVNLSSGKNAFIFANMDGDERELLAFRGRREEVEKAEKFIFKELQEFIGEHN